MVATASRSVMGRLGLAGGVTAASVPSIDFKFEPSIIIAAGKIDRLGGLIKDFKEPLTMSITKVMMPSIAQNFAAGGRPAWPAWSEATIEIMRNMGVQSRGLLQRSGALESIASSFGIWTITNAFATITDIPLWYAKIQQGGYDGNSMSHRVKAAGGNRKAALESLMDQQLSKLGGKYLTGGKVTAVRGGAMAREAAPIPARPFIMFQPEDEDHITEIFIAWMEVQIQKAYPAGT